MSGSGAPPVARFPAYKASSVRHTCSHLTTNYNCYYRSIIMTTPVPSPPAVPFLGHINTLDKDLPIKSLNLLAQQYGEIFQLTMFGMAFGLLS